ncbi:MAG: hypothetical protein AAF645_01260 [Myxococcota bacterium]
MRYALLTLFVLSFGVLPACGGEAPASEPASEAATTAGGTDEAPAEASTPPCQRNSSEVCECPSGGSALRVCLEGTWTDCPCEGVDDFDDGFSDEA